MSSVPEHGPRKGAAGLLESKCQGCGSYSGVPLESGDVYCEACLDTFEEESRWLCGIPAKRAK